LPDRGRKRMHRKPTRAELREEFERADSALMEAIVAGCAMVAYADGWVTEEEHLRMTQLIRAFDPVAAFGMADVLSHFEDVSARFKREHEEGMAHAFQHVSLLRGHPRECGLLIQTCCAIAESDGGFDAAEREVIISLCELLRVSPKLYGLVPDQ
jgi:tellurite resistance protein TerB